MAKDYGRRRPVKQKSSAPQQLFWILISFFCGYLTAMVFDFNSLSGWIKANIASQKNEEKPVLASPRQVELPKPKFEFYTLLAKDKVNSATSLSRPHPQANITESQSMAPRSPQSPLGATLTEKIENKPVAVSASTNKETYLVQVASFRNRQDAEHMKALLTLKGFDVSVSATIQHQMDWYRVIVGPFATKEDAEKVQFTLAQSEHVKGMIRKMAA
ncbi:SPOR domain-containing protein [Legionella fairfieldensis]|uniref:SPOR domain-containing protein n=1 Tax=Legionella fairfieldensis TaxID=45064 RepID=UPI00048FCDD4|nr:SPOR domain-containing protein [Legionella fairfieldensis]